MGLEGADSLERMLVAHERLTLDTGRRIADAGTDRLHRNVRRLTPIDTNPFRHKPERPRGFLKGSLRRLPGIRYVRRVAGNRWEGEIESLDPIIWRHVEFDTVPHVIRARPGGRLRFQSRYGWVGADGTVHPPGTWVSVEEVQHPGTQGQHMMSRGAVLTEVEIDEYAGPELRRWKRRVEGARF